MGVKAVLRWALAAALIAGSAPALAQAGPFDSGVGVSANPSTASLDAGVPFTVDFVVSLAGVDGVGCGGAPTTALLGRYSVPVEFTADRLDLLGVEPAVAGPYYGPISGFPAPTATDLDDANSTGTLLVAATGLSSIPPGATCLFRLRFVQPSDVVGTANATIRFRTSARGPYELESARLSCPEGPVGPALFSHNPDLSIVLTPSQYVEPARIDRMTPSFGPLAGGPVELQGRALDSVSGVRVGSTSLPIVFRDSSTVRFGMPPASTPGPVTVTVFFNLNVLYPQPPAAFTFTYIGNVDVPTLSTPAFVLLGGLLALAALVFLKSTRG